MPYKIADSLISRYHIQKQVDLRLYNNIHIGGTADYVAEAHSKDTFTSLYQTVLKEEIPLQILGSGTNVFFADAGLRQLLIIIKFADTTLLDENTIRVAAGTPMYEVNRFCIEHCLTGFEFSSGIPGTVGGAIYGNAGAYGRNIGECLVSARILDKKGQVITVRNEEMGFEYRHSALKTNGCILIDADIRLEKGNYQQILSKVREIRSIRYKKLPHWSVPTAGSFFKNIKDADGNATAAAVYLDAVGSKQTSVGGAAVHPKHANVIYNRENATAQDILALETILRTRVQEKFGITLQREVMYIE